MSALSPYWKLIQFVLLAIGGTFAVDIRNGHISGKEWVTLGVYAAGAVVLYFKRNTPTQPHAKAAVAVFAAGVAAVTSAWSDNVISPEEIVAIFLALVAAINTGAVANVPPGPQPEAPASVGDVHDQDYPYSAGAVE